MEDWDTTLERIMLIKKLRENPEMLERIQRLNERTAAVIAKRERFLKRIRESIERIKKDRVGNER